MVLLLSSVFCAHWGSSYLCEWSKITGKPFKRLKYVFMQRYKHSTCNTLNGVASWFLQLSYLIMLYWCD